MSFNTEHEEVNMLISSFSLQAGLQEESQNLGYQEFQGEEDQAVQKLDDLVKKASSKCERLEALNLSRRSSRDHSVNPIPRPDFSFSHNPSLQQDLLQMNSVPLDRDNSLLIPDQMPSIQRDQSLLRETSLNAELRLWHELSQPKEPSMAVSQTLPPEPVQQPQQAKRLGRSEEDVASHSTNDSKLQPAPKGKVNLVQLVTRMGNENALNISDYCDEFGVEEKTIVANLVYIKCPKFEISPTLDTETFIKQVNKVLREKKEKRKDDQLRFVYKKAIRNLLCKATEYAPSKSAKMEDYTDKFLKFYFTEKTERNKDVLDTSYASVKRIRTYFHDSPMFKEHFLENALKTVVKEYEKYTEETYTKMCEVMIEHIRNSPQGERIRVDILRNRYKRIPWSCLDIIDSINLIKGSCNGGISS